MSPEIFGLLLVAIALFTFAAFGAWQVWGPRPSTEEIARRERAKRAANPKTEMARVVRRPSELEGDGAPPSIFQPLFEAPAEAPRSPTTTVEILEQVSVDRAATANLIAELEAEVHSAQNDTLTAIREAKAAQLEVERLQAELAMRPEPNPVIRAIATAPVDRRTLAERFGVDPEEIDSVVSKAEGQVLVLEPESDNPAYIWSAR